MNESSSAIRATTLATAPAIVQMSQVEFTGPGQMESVISIEVNGIDLNSLASRHRDRFRADSIGLVFQHFNLLPFLSVEVVPFNCCSIPFSGLATRPTISVGRVCRT